MKEKESALYSHYIIDGVICETTPAELLDESQELNVKRWDILDKKVHQNYQALGSYEAEVKTVKDYITTRLQTLDALIRK